MSLHDAVAVSAGVVAGALADSDRRSVFAAVQLGAAHVADVATVSGLSVAQVGKALGKLVDVGLVTVANGRLTIAAAVFQQAARAALARPSVSEHDSLPVADRKVMNAFVVDGRLQSIPSSPGKRLVILDWLAQLFEPGRYYSEAMVNLTLGQRHADTAALRRYLVDEGLLDREAGVYWRSGGSVVNESTICSSTPTAPRRTRTTTHSVWLETRPSTRFGLRTAVPPGPIIQTRTASRARCRWRPSMRRGGWWEIRSDGGRTTSRCISRWRWGGHGRAGRPSSSSRDTIRSLAIRTRRASRGG